MGFLSNIFGGGSGKSAALASLVGAQMQAGAQRESLEYLKGVEELPQMFREGALTRLAGMYGLEGGEGAPMADQEMLLERAQTSPFYTAMLEGGEEAVLRSAAATGGLRSGGTISDLKDVQNEALLASYNQQISDEARQIAGLEGLAGLQSYAPQIAQQTANIGATLGQGTTAAAQAKIAGQNQGFSNLMGLGSLGLGALAFSDIRLKENIEHVGFVGDHKWYVWDWNDEAKTLGLEGKGQGVMAHEVDNLNPDIIGEQDGYITVDYEALFND